MGAGSSSSVKYIRPDKKSVDLNQDDLISADEICAELRKYSLACPTQRAEFLINKFATSQTKDASGMVALTPSEFEQALPYIEGLASSPYADEANAAWNAVPDSLTVGLDEKKSVDALLARWAKRGVVVDEAAARHSKFAASGENFTFDYGDISQFFEGLEGLVGSPSPDVRRTMGNEHASDVPFDTHNVFGTTPRLEWQYVTEKEVGDSSVTNRAQDKTGGRPGWRLSDFVAHPKCVEAKLIVEEVIGIRLYTGPMYVWYNNGTLRKRKKGQFVTTLHAINSAILKLSRHTKACTVYRGVAGGVLPDVFWTPNQHGIMGGVELGFMSTTTDRSVAMDFASHAGGGGKCAMVFTIKMGMIDRGASVSFMSQFPGENEILCAARNASRRRTYALCPLPLTS